MDDILARLAAPFPTEVVSWRVGNTNREVTQAMALAYIDARDVQDRLDHVCGVYWQVRHPWAVGTKLACEIGILINGEWHWRGDGAGDSDIEAEKGAFSDSFKRAAVRWGIGRYLYDISSPWVAVDSYTDKNGKLRAKGIKDSEIPKLRGALVRAAGATANPPPNTSKAPTQTQAGTEVDPWRLSVRAITVSIDASPHLVGLNNLMDQKGIDAKSDKPRVGSDLEVIKAASEEAYAFLVDRAQKKRGQFLQAPPAQRKAS